MRWVFQFNCVFSFQSPRKCPHSPFTKGGMLPDPLILTRPPARRWFLGPPAAACHAKTMVNANICSLLSREPPLKELVSESIQLPPASVKPD